MLQEGMLPLRIYRWRKVATEIRFSQPSTEEMVRWRDKGVGLHWEHPRATHEAKKIGIESSSLHPRIFLTVTLQQGIWYRREFND